MQPDESRQVEPRWWFVAYSAGLGLLVAGAAWIGGIPVVAAAAVPLLVAFGIAMALTPYGRLRRRSVDEREESILEDALKHSAVAIVVVTLALWLWGLARGEPSPELTLIGATGGATHAVSMAVLSRRR